MKDDEFDTKEISAIYGRLSGEGFALERGVPESTAKGLARFGGLVSSPPVLSSFPAGRTVNLRGEVCMNIGAREGSEGIKTPPHIGEESFSDLREMSEKEIEAWA